MIVAYKTFLKNNGCLTYEIKVLRKKQWLCF